MNKNEQKIEYFIYARKSSESEERQVQSIDDQVNRLKQLASSSGLKIKKIYTESKTAKQPGIRPIFEEMMKKIEAGEANGILCWQINRLSRNPIDSARIQWLLQQGKIKNIQTFDRTYLPDDNTLLYSVETGMANQFILDLSKNVKRGVQSKLEKGWRPGNAPAGYKNELYDHTIETDAERFNLIKKAWSLLLTNEYTVPKILDKLNNDWGFRSLKKRKSGNKPLSTSGLYRVFTNVFYAGIIEHKGQQYPGKHKPMITLEEYDKAQILLGRAGKPRSTKHQFAYTGLIKCGHCDCLITAETKNKIIKSTNETRKYTYYRCTRKKTDIKCKQQPISLGELEPQIIKELNELTILPEFRDWALNNIKASNDAEIEDRTKIYEMQHRSIAEKQTQLDNLTKMRYRGLINDDEFLKEKSELQNEIIRLRDNLRGTEQRTDTWIELTERAFKFAATAKEAFENGSLETKREIVRTLGSKFTLLDKKLYFEPECWIQKMKDAAKEINTDSTRLELQKILANKGKTGDFSPALPRLHRRRDSN